MEYPARFRTYQLIGLIGKGAYARVHAAMGTEYEDPLFAIKILDAEATSQEPDAVIAQQRFIQEAEILRQLTCPHVVRIFDAGEHEHRLYIVMELLQESLAAHLKAKGPLKWPKALKMLEELATGLDCVHRFGVKHRDIKPDNILLDAHDNPKLSDFGVAKLVGSLSLTASKGIVGTHQYVAPEIWRGEEPTYASDRYSLAAVFGEMLCGHALFRASNPAAVMSMHLMGRPDFPIQWPAGVPPRILEVLEPALDPNPEGRFKTCADFCRALHEIEPRMSVPIRHWHSHPCLSSVTSLWADGPDLWAASEDGLIRWNPCGTELERHTNRGGLPSAKLRAITKHQGLLWIGTSQGPWLRSGTEWSRPTGMPEELGSAEVRAFHSADTGLWMATNAGAWHLQHGAWYSFRAGSPPTGLPSDDVRAVAVRMRDNCVWLVTPKGLCRHLGPGWSTYADEPGVPLQETRTVTIARDGCLWLGTPYGALQYDDRRWRALTSANSGLVDDDVRAVLPVNDGSLWFGTARGACSWQQDWRRQEQGWTSYLARLPVLALAQRFGEDTVWMGTPQGVFPQPPRPNRPPLRASGPMCSLVHTICQGAKGTLWFGTEQGIGCYEGSRWLPSADGLEDESVFALCEAVDSALWAGTGSGLRRLAPNRWVPVTRGVPPGSVRALLRTRTGELWVAGDHGVALVDASGSAHLMGQGLPRAPVLCLAELRNGTLLCGTSARGLFSWSGSQWTHMPGLEALEGPGCQLQSLLEGRDGYLWLGTARGLARLEGRHLSWPIGPVGSRSIRSLVEDYDGAIWAATDDGAFRLTATRCERFGVDKLVSDQVNCILRARNNTLWFATDRGVSELR